jgi:hypothetical protein
MTMTEKIKVVAYVDSDMMGYPEDVPSHVAPNTLLVPEMTEGGGTYADGLGTAYAPLDAVGELAPGIDRPMMWALFDRDGSAEEKIAALAEYRSS